jgi:hypothetical protein
VLLPPPSGSRILPALEGLPPLVLLPRLRLAAAGGRAMLGRHRQALQVSSQQRAQLPASSAAAETGQVMTA